MKGYRLASSNTILRVAALLLCMAVLCAAARADEPKLTPAEEAALKQAAEWFRAAPDVKAHYEYTMTGRVRFVFFWVGRDDVGGGYIRRAGVSGQSMEGVDLLIGSDPEKAPRRINRWGAAREVVRRGAAATRDAEASAFFGFMTQAKGEASAAELEAQMAEEKAGKAFRYQGVITMLDSRVGVAKTVPFASDKDFNIRGYEEAKQRVFSELDRGASKVRKMDAARRQSCSRNSGFLASVAELVDGALADGARTAEVCYIHYGELYTLRLERTSPVSSKPVQYELKKEPKKFTRTYTDLARMEFIVRNLSAGKKSSFELLMGTRGELRGVPVQITYQPNFWFQVILNLRPAESRLARH